MQFPTPARTIASRMVLLLMGVSGCGKTTVGRVLARRLGWPFHDADDYHPPANVEKMSRKQPLTDADRRPWLEKLSAMIRAWVDRGENAVLGCSALTAESRRLLDTDDPAVRLVYLRGSYDLILERLHHRTDHFMPADLLSSQFQTLEEPADALMLDIHASPEELAGQIIASLPEVVDKSRSRYNGRP